MRGLGCGGRVKFLIEVWHISRATIAHQHQAIFAGTRPAFVVDVFIMNKKAQLSLTNPRDAKACQKLSPIRRAYNVVADNTGLSSFV